jgi:cytochrome P450
LLALLRVALRGDGDLLSLLPANAYRMEIGPLGYSRRSILIVNRPDQVRRVLSDPEGIFPKSDLMVEALAPLIGDSLFVSSGDTWRRQRRNWLYGVGSRAWGSWASSSRARRPMRCSSSARACSTSVRS